MASSWLVSAAARSPARWMASTSVDERVVGVDPAQEDLAAPEDDGQQVVEVVRHAAGQAGHGAEPLGLVELLEHALALGDVLGHGQDARDRSLVVEQRRRRHRQLAALRRRGPGLEIGTPTVASPCAVRSHRSRQRRRGGVVGRRDAPRRRTAPWPSQPNSDPGGAVPPPGRAGQVELGDGQGRGLHDGLQPLLVALHGLVEPGVVEGHVAIWASSTSTDSSSALNGRAPGRAPRWPGCASRSSRPAAPPSTARPAAPDGAELGRQVGSATSRPAVVAQRAVGPGHRRHGGVDHQAQARRQRRRARSPPPRRRHRCSADDRAVDGGGRTAGSTGPRPARRRGPAGRARTPPAAPAARPAGR